MPARQLSFYRSTVGWPFSNLPGWDMVRQLDSYSSPHGAVDRVIDGSFMELKWGAANAIRWGRKAVCLDKLPWVCPVGSKGKKKRVLEQLKKIMKGKHIIFKGHDIACLTKQTQKIVSNSFHALEPRINKRWEAKAQVQPGRMFVCCGALGGGTPSSVVHTAALGWLTGGFI